MKKGIGRGIKLLSSWCGHDEMIWVSRMHMVKAVGSSYYVHSVTLCIIVGIVEFEYATIGLLQLRHVI
jgi:hypothetical protein